MKNPAPLIFIILLAIALAYGLFSYWGGGQAPPRSSLAVPQASAACMEGQLQYCREGNCSGLSTCIGGSWGKCRWERVCSPGSKATCLENSCVYAIKVCNECGTGYGPCVGINASG